ncbi:MAG: hypothetical protein IJ192_02310 [Clostridia bacterium]|nr:hypothetical protein [Clostridia bacterium]
MICNYDGCGCERPERHEKRDCSPCMRGIMILVGIIGGLIFAAIAVTLFISSILAWAGFTAWVALVTALVYLLVLLVIALTSETSGKVVRCIRCYLGGLIFGIFGTIFAGFLGIVSEFALISFFSALIVGLIAFFFAYMIISVLFLIRCVID